MPGVTVSWQQLQPAKGNWSEARLQSSSESEAHQRFVFPSIYQTIIPGVAERERLLRTKSLAWTGLPLIAEHAQNWSWYGPVLEALEGKHQFTIARLHESALPVTVRMRVGPP